MPESSPPADTLVFDAEWFTQRVIPEAAVAYEQQLREKYGPRPKPLARSGGGAIWMYSALAVWAVLGVLILVWTTVWMPADQRQLDEPLERIMFGLVLLLPYSIAYGLLASWLTWVFFGHHGPERYARFRLHSFAERNGLDYEPFVALNDRDQVTDIVRFTRGRAIEIGNLQTVVPGTQSGATVFLYSYVAVGLTAVLPHIVLDARANQLQLAIGSGVDDDQRLSLEGDFGRHFTLYCPTGYERDALYLFAPDVMAAFIDGARTLDAEIRGNVLVLSCAETLSEPDPRAWQLIASALNALLPKLEDWERWRDDRPDASTDLVAVPGETPLIRRTLADPAVAPLRRRRSRFGLWVTLTVLTYVGALVVLAMILS